jgi:hypothetical protein
LVRSSATNQIVNEGTWFNASSTPLRCPTPAPANSSCLPAGPITNQLFLDLMENHQGAPDTGLALVNTLFDIPRSASSYSTPNGEQYLHILTNVNAVEGAWNAQSLPNGRYQVSVETADFNDNLAALTRFVTVHDPATTLDITAPGFADVYVKDHPSDIGAVPSNLGGQVFWQSPDLILVPVGTTVTVDSPAQQTQVTAGVQYWAYLRVHNGGCSPISGVKGRLFSADPSAINTSWQAITPGTEYVGDAANPDGVTVPAGGRALLGPFTWTPTATDAQFGGHRCLLGAISAANDATPSGAEFDAPNHNNVGQRNLQVSNCAFHLPHPTGATANLGLTLTTDAEVENAAHVVEVLFDFDASWLAAWSAVAGAEVRQQGAQLVVRLRARSVTLPTVQLAAGAVRNLSFGINLPDGTPTRTVNLIPTLNGGSVSGVSCSDSGGPILE